MFNLLVESIAAAGADLWTSHNNFWARIFRQSNNKKKKGLLFHKCQPPLSYPFWSLSSETQLFFFLHRVLLSLTHKHLRSKNKRRLMCYPTGLETGWRGQASWARLLPDATAELRVTPPRTVLVWSDRVDKATPALQPPVCSCSSIYSNSVLVLQPCASPPGTHNLELDGQY